MKKLMMVAAAVALAANSYGIALTNCTQKISTDCPQVVFKVTASGKTVTDKGDYKTVAKLSVKKGALVLFGEKVKFLDRNGKTQEDCCYNAWSLYLQVKVAKETYNVCFANYDLQKWTVFGKNLDAAMTTTKSKKYKLESDIALIVDDDDTAADDDVPALNEITGVTMIATAFGKATYKYGSKTTKKTDCEPCKTTTTEDLIPGNYSGWFAGVYDLISDAEECMVCNCSEYDIFGGTWKAKYNKSWSAEKLGWVPAAEYVFGGTTARGMAANEIE